MKFLVDANVLSEPTNPAPHAQVIEWLRNNEAELATTPIVLGELEYGILLLPAGQRKKRLHLWFSTVIRHVRLLDVDADCAAAWARLLAGLKKKGLAMPVKDSLIAATAHAHDLTVATRNIADFRHAGTPLVNPFKN